MRLLVAISSCQAYENSGLNAPLRETWLKDLTRLGIDYKFFHGRGATPKDDVVLVDCDDGYWDLTSKTKLKIKWSLDNGYDYVFMCFPDTYVCASRLLTSGFEQFDYFGCVHQHPGGSPYCQGGPGYFLSRKACEVLDKKESNYPNEDCWVGDQLHNNYEIHRGDSKAFSYCGPGPLKTNHTITNHLSTQPGGYVGTNVFSEHKLWLESLEQ
jgi:hypothetical protein